MDLDQIGLAAVFMLGSVFLGWFLVGGEYNRRRAGRLAHWVYAGLKPLLGKASVRWLTTHAFEVFVEDARSPFQSLKVTGLLESRDMVAIWAYNRLTFRPDLLVLRANLRREPRWGCEILRRGTVLYGDARREAEASRWTVQPAGTDLEIWHGGGKAANLCARLAKAARAAEHDLLRVGVHPAEPHLVLAVSAARFQQQQPDQLFGVFQHLAAIALE